MRSNVNPRRTVPTSHYSREEYLAAWNADPSEYTPRQRRMMKDYPRSGAAYPGRMLLEAVTTPDDQRTRSMLSRLRTHRSNTRSDRIVVAAQAEVDARAAGDACSTETQRRIRRYILAREAFEQAIKPRGYGHARVLRMSDPIVIKYRKAREDLLDLAGNSLRVDDAYAPQEDEE